MSARNDMLKAIRKNKPAPSPLPDMSDFAGHAKPLLESFTQVLTKIGGQVETVASLTELEARVAALYTRHPVVCCTVQGVSCGANFPIGEVTDPHDLAHIDLAVIPARLGVAENGSVWVQEEDMGHRALPFITQHLAVVLPVEKLVWNLHQAYQQLNLDGLGYGMFLAGPSKTADIEQSLVIGAHGARSLTAFLVTG
jgi:L-lactate dehydrogenase complex protein LldG